MGVMLSVESEGYFLVRLLQVRTYERLGRNSLLLERDGVQAMMKELIRFDVHLLLSARFQRVHCLRKGRLSHV